MENMKDLAAARGRQFDVPRELRFAVYEEGPWWLAQGIEIDILVHGASPDELSTRCDLALREEDLLGSGLGRIGPPPEHIVRLWEKHGGITVINPVPPKG